MKNMKLVSFSVTNYRSISKAKDLMLKQELVIVGKNNEGKSNLLKAISTAMQIVKYNGNNRVLINAFGNRRSDSLYIWERDFPLQFQGRTSGTESIFRLYFRLEGNELQEFQNELKIRGNEDIPIEIRIGKDNKPKLKVLKRGTSSYNEKSTQVTEFISKKISFNYIQAIRTDDTAMNALTNVIASELADLNRNEEYLKAKKTVEKLRKDKLDSLAKQLIKPMQVFLPNINDISISSRTIDDFDDHLDYIFANRIDMIIDDGVPTSISNKGDGIKSLAALSILNDRKRTEGASVIAIEEPESHLHSGAIHSLVNVLETISDNNQVIISTHNPLFVNVASIDSNIIVDKGLAYHAKTISEIREILGVQAADNLADARFVIVVEGKHDADILEHLIKIADEELYSRLNSNLLIIKPLNGVANLSNTLFELRNSMCKYVVLLDNDSESETAYQKAKDRMLLDDSAVKFTMVKGLRESELEDSINIDLYKDYIKEKYGIELTSKAFKTNRLKWSERMKRVFEENGTKWNDAVSNSIKKEIVNSVLNYDSIGEVLIPNRTDFFSSFLVLVKNAFSFN